MKNLTKLFICIFAFSTVLSCEPQELEEQDEIKVKEYDAIEPVGETGDQEYTVDDGKKA